MCLQCALQKNQINLYLAKQIDADRKLRSAFDALYTLMPDVKNILKFFDKYDWSWPKMKPDYDSMMPALIKRYQKKQEIVEETDEANVEA